MCSRIVRYLWSAKVEILLTLLLTGWEKGVYERTCV